MTTLGECRGEAVLLLFQSREWDLLRVSPVNSVEVEAVSLWISLSLAACKPVGGQSICKD